MSDHNQAIATASMNTAAGLAVLGSLLGWLPQAISILASLTAIILFSLQIWESKTVTDWRKRRRER